MTEVRSPSDGKEQASADYAPRLAEDGYLVLPFDAAYSPAARKTRCSAPTTSSATQCLIWPGLIWPARTVPSGSRGRVDARDELKAFFGEHLKA